MAKSGREAKRKATQVFRREQQKFFSSAFRPKPKWIPWGMWKFLMNLVLKVDNT
jgi:hypothetical protein